MPFLTCEKDTDTPHDYSLECEFTHITIRIFILNKERIGSFTVISSGIDAARITDLTLIEPHKFNKVIFKTINSKLKALGFKKVSFERQTKNNKFSVRTYEL